MINGHIVTLEESQPIAEALAIQEGKIIAVGRNEAILALARKGNIPQEKGQERHRQSSTRHQETAADARVQQFSERVQIIDLQGKTVVPGFVDAHVHLMGTGLNLLGIRMNDANSIEEVVERIRQRASISQPGELILASGLDTNRFAVERIPTRAELDAAAPDNPVFINRVDSHSCAVNTQMMDRLQVPLELEGVEKGPDGTPSGFMRKQANSYVRNRLLEIIPDEMRTQAACVAADAAIKVGITTVHALEGGPLFNDKDVEALIRVQDQLPIHLIVWHQTMDIDQVQSLGLNRVGGCIVLDGSFTSRTAALYEDYSDDPGNNGVLYYDQETVNRFVEKAHRAGMQISVHVLAERAIDQILEAYERAHALYPRTDARYRLEHFELPTNDQIARAAKLGVVLSMQPAFEYYWGGSGMYGLRLGSERAARSNPFLSILKAGGIIVGGSDSDVTDMNPLVGIQGAMTHSNPDERLNAMEALKLFTMNPAYSVYEEKERGTIQVGKYADLTILDQNPLTTEPAQIDQIQIMMTIVEGKIVYTKN